MADWEIAAQAAQSMKTIQQLAQEFGLKEEEVIPYGHYTGKIDFLKLLKRKASTPRGHMVNVTAITPTPLGSGKSTVTMGLIQGLAAIGKKATGAIRQPSMGPTFNIKGSAAGGGLSQCIPLNDFSLGLTGDIDAITKAHNLGMVALTARMQHEFNYSDAVLQSKNLRRLDIDPQQLSQGWAMDLCAQSLRTIIMGIGGKQDGFMSQSGFQISVSSELMAILSVAVDLPDMRRRIARMIMAYSKSGAPITAADLEVDGAMTALLTKALQPNLLQTIEGQPVLVHTGPFANIALGQSSIIADQVGTAMADYHLTESGFGADIGFEKFWNLKSRFSKITPSAAVLVVTIRDLKLHGGAPAVKGGVELPEEYRSNRPDLVKAGLDNMRAHLDIIRKSGVNPVVCLNHFYTDSDEEVQVVLDAAADYGVRAAVSKHWLKGGAGARELAQAVVEACEEPVSFKFLYQMEESLPIKVERIAREIYGADGVDFGPLAEKKLKRIAELEKDKPLGCCMAKTQFSLSDQAELKNRPKGWRLHIKDILVYQGAGFVVPVAGDIKLMPGTASNPAFRRIDVDVDSGEIKGVF